MKIVFIIIDGLGDKPIPALGNRTPLEVAKTPNLDWLAENGICGLIKPVYAGAIPTSEDSHSSLFGYNPKIYPAKRGIFTAEGAGIKLRSNDVALRGNFGTVDKKLNIINRRAGRIKNTEPLINALNGMIVDNIKFLVKKAGGHRAAIVLRGENLSSNISDSDPHYAYLGKKIREVIPLDKGRKAKSTAQVLNKFLKETHRILKNHPFNKKRERMGSLPANYLLVREAGSLQKIPTFRKKYNLKACCIAGKLLYKQIGKSLGMKMIEVKGATGLVNTNLKGKLRAAKNALKKYDFVFCHIKAADSLGEDGNFIGKKEFIEKIDKNLKVISGLKNTLIIVTGDHSTCSLLKRHCSVPVPVLIWKKGIEPDRVKKFGERACKEGKLGLINGLRLMPKVRVLARVN